MDSPRNKTADIRHHSAITALELLLATRRLEGLLRDLCLPTELLGVVIDVEGVRAFDAGEIARRLELPSVTVRQRISTHSGYCDEQLRGQHATHPLRFKMSHSAAVAESRFHHPAEQRPILTACRLQAIADGIDGGVRLAEDL